MTGHLCKYDQPTPTSCLGSWNQDAGLGKLSATYRGWFKPFWVLMLIRSQAGIQWAVPLFHQARCPRVREPAVAQGGCRPATLGTLLLCGERPIGGGAGELVLATAPPKGGKFLCRMSACSRQNKWSFCPWWKESNVINSYLPGRPGKGARCQAPHWFYSEQVGRSVVGPPDSLRAGSPGHWAQADVLI